MANNNNIYDNSDNSKTNLFNNDNTNSIKDDVLSLLNENNDNIISLYNCFINNKPYTSIMKELVKNIAIYF